MDETLRAADTLTQANGSGYTYEAFVTAKGSVTGLPSGIVAPCPGICLYKLSATEFKTTQCAAIVAKPSDQGYYLGQFGANAWGAGLGAVMASPTFNLTDLNTDLSNIANTARTAAQAAADASGIVLEPMSDRAVGDFIHIFTHFYTDLTVNTFDGLTGKTAEVVGGVDKSVIENAKENWVKPGVHVRTQVLDSSNATVRDPAINAILNNPPCGNWVLGKNANHVYLLQWGATLPATYTNFPGLINDVCTSSGGNTNLATFVNPA